MKAISGRSSAVKGAATLVLEPVAGGPSAFSSGFKFTSAMLTYFRSLTSRNDGRGDKPKRASHRVLKRPSCRAHHIDDRAATQNALGVGLRCGLRAFSQPLSIQAAGAGGQR